MKHLTAGIAVLFVLFASPAFAQTIPVPTPRPQTIEQHKALALPLPPQKKPIEQITTKPQLPKSDIEKSACFARLAALNVNFKPEPQINDPKGCAIDNPVLLIDLPDGIQLTPAALLDCETAIIFARFIQGPVQTRAKEIFASRVKSVKHDSAYVCRPRNGTSKLSEHAYGRAVDIGAFTLTSGLNIPVVETPKEQVKEALFLTEVRAAACGPFKTVLGPGSDADHALHFHFDMAPRKGSAYCR